MPAAMFVDEGGGAVSAIDLANFCSRDPHRTNLHQPWTREGYAWATNGVVLLRVPERADVEDRPDIPSYVHLRESLNRTCTYRSWKFLLPAPLAARKIMCETCRGRGTEHNCPDCECECGWCDGRGHFMLTPEDQESHISVSYAGVDYALAYIRLIASLPDLEIEVAPPLNGATRFIFAGGDGLLMPLARPYETHLGDLAEAA